MNNLEAAIRDQPKPINFGPTAGTVLCPGCVGKPHRRSFTPNVTKMFRLEVGLNLSTFVRDLDESVWRLFRCRSGCGHSTR